MKQEKNVHLGPGSPGSSEQLRRLAELERSLALCLVTMDCQEREITRLSAETARLARDLLRERQARLGLNTMLSLARGELAGARKRLQARDAGGRFVRAATP